MVTRREVVGAAVAGTVAAGLWKPCVALGQTGAAETTGAIGGRAAT